MRKISWIIGAVLAVGFLWWVLSSGEDSVGLPQIKIPGVSKGDTSAEIQQGLEEIDLNDIGKEFEAIDADINNL